MASNKGLTAVHGSLIFFVAVSVILAVVAYLNYSELKVEAARADKNATELSNEQKTHRVLDQSVQDLKKKIGHDMPQVGAPESDGDNTVLGETNADIKKFAPGDLAQGTVRETLMKLSEALGQMTQERNTISAEKEKLQQTIDGLQKQYQEAVTANERAREDAEKDRDKAQQTKEETIKAKDEQIAELQQNNRTVNLELQQEKDTNAKTVTELKQHIDRLSTINVSLREKQEQEQDLSFDQPDGTIEWVDNDTKLVWINLGEADNLKKKTTFSVYTKGHFGVGRREKRDIKGAIEVTRIIGPHQAEARIINDRLTDPVAPGDPIYTPLWGSQKQEHFALVGLIDLDNDGRDDRKRLHDILEGANAILDVEIDDQGVRVPAEGRMSVQTKFLIVGTIPDPTKSKPDEQKAHIEIGKRLQELKSEALEQGVRIVNLNSFQEEYDLLDFVGYKAKRRLWQPGADNGWNLKKGSRAPRSAVMGTESTGQTSGLYSRDRRLAPPEAGGRYRSLAPPESTGQTGKSQDGSK